MSSRFQIQKLFDPRDEFGAVLIALRQVSAHSTTGLFTDPTVRAAAEAVDRVEAACAALGKVSTVWTQPIRFRQYAQRATKSEELRAAWTPQ
jgi:hypothetical protein